MKNFVSILGGMVLTITAGQANAGGFGTEGVNTAGELFNNKLFVVQGGVQYFSAQRNRSGATGTSTLGFPAIGVNAQNGTDDFALGDFSVKAKVNDAIDCMGRYSQPYRLTTTNSDPAFVGRYVEHNFDIDSTQISATCSYKFEISDGKIFRAIGGIRALSVGMQRTNYINVAAGAPLAADQIHSLTMESADLNFGYRLGASFEIPEYLVRAQVFYDSSIKAELSGSQVYTLASTGTALLSSSVKSDIETPQAVTARLQVPVSQSAIMWAGVRWEDWSNLSSLDVSGALPGDISLATNFDDGWKAEIGGAMKVNDDLSVQAAITWTQGIGGGYTDSWSFGTGVAYDIDDNWRVSVGGAAILVTGSSESSTVAGTAATSNYTQDDDWQFVTGMRLQYALN